MTDDRVRVRVGETVHEGAAVTVTGVDPRQMATAVTADGSVGEPPVAVEGPDPEPLHEYVGAIRAGMGLRTRTALAAAGRSRGLETPHDDALAAARERLDAVDPPDTDPELRSRRHALSETGTDTDRLRERVAAARGRLAAEDPDAEEELVSAVRKLSEAETDRRAARERLDGARTTAREVRDRLERRRRLQDRVGNLEREARAHLTVRLAEPFAAALAALGRDVPADPFDADPVAAALAVAQVGQLAAPVAVEGAAVPFDGAREAGDWLGGPVVYVR